MNEPIITGDSLQIRFAAPWSRESYELFLRTKRLPESSIAFDQRDESYTLTAPARFASLLGIEAPRREVCALPIATYLFDYQQWIVRLALAARRFCIWADCGLGKTPMFLEFARQGHALEGGKWLIFSPRNVIPQTVSEAERFYGDALPIRRIQTRAELIEWAKAPLNPDEPWLAITNYEKLVPQKDSPQQVLNELRWLTGVIVDESSILKTKGGTIKWALMKSTYGVPFKLSCTATPAPNDALEYLSQAGFLDKFNDNSGEGAALASYFKLEADGTCKLKPHAREAFFRFMASWSIYLRKPSAYGFADPFADVPEPEIVEMKVTATREQAADAHAFLTAKNPHYLFASEKLGVVERNKLSQIAKGFLYDKGKPTRRIASRKPATVAKLVRTALKEKRQCLVWTVYDEESTIIREQLGNRRGVAVLTGTMDEDERDEILWRFARGKIRVLISKAALLGYGLNFQFCTRMIFSGFDDSFERLYQAIRRAYRYGSVEQLKVFIPFVPGLENHMWENLLRKKGQWETDTAEQEVRYRAAAEELGRVPIAA